MLSAPLLRCISSLLKATSAAVHFSISFVSSAGTVLGAVAPKSEW